MAKLKLTKFEWLQLSVFLENRPPKDFPKTSEWRKVSRAAEEIQKNLGEYYTKFSELQLKTETLKMVYMNEFSKLVQENRDIVVQEGNTVSVKPEKDLTPVQKKQATKYKKETLDIEDRANKDTKLKEANELFLDFQKVDVIINRRRNNITQ